MQEPPDSRSEANEQTWARRELAMLRAIRQAEEAGEDLNNAARSAVPGLPEALYSETIAALSDGGFLDAAVESYGDGRLLVHVRRLRERGREAVGQWPSPPSTHSVQERRARRLLLMDTLYDELGDNKLAVASVDALTSRLGWEAGSAEPVVEFLLGQGLVERHYGNQVSITH